MWLIVQGPVLEEGRVDVFSCSGGVGEVRPHWMEGERTLRQARWVPGLWQDGRWGGFAEGLIQQLGPRSALPDLGVPATWSTLGSIYLG